MAEQSGGGAASGCLGLVMLVAVVSYCSSGHDEQPSPAENVAAAPHSSVADDPPVQANKAAADRLADTSTQMRKRWSRFRLLFSLAIAPPALANLDTSEAFTSTQRRTECAT